MSKFLTYEYRIYPNKKQKELILLTFKMCRYMYNTLLKEKADIFHQFVEYSNDCQKKGINLEEKIFSKKHKLSKIKDLKNLDKRYLKVDSLSLYSELSHLNRAFENFYSGRTKFPKYKKRKDKNTYTTSNVNENIRIGGKNKIRLPKLGYVKAVLHRKLPYNSKIKRAIIKEDKTGKYYVSFVLEVEKTDKKIEVKKEKIVGLDYKVGEIFVTSKGDTPKFGRPYKSALRKLRYLEKKLSLKEKFSKGYWNFIRKIRILHQKVSRKRKDFLHKLSDSLSKKYEYIGIEDISLKEIASKLSTGINVYETRYAGFIEMVKYKTCQKVVSIDKWFPSSKLCSKCGNKKKKLKLEQRIYKCSKCGLVIDRDENAAINIANESLRLLNRG